MKQTAVEWLVEQLKTMDTKSFNRLIQIEMSRENFEECFEQAKAMEKEQSHKYAEFAIRCDRKDMKILNFEDWIKLETKSE